jgi:hypothetical protein
VLLNNKSKSVPTKRKSLLHLHGHLPKPVCTTHAPYNNALANRYSLGQSTALSTDVTSAIKVTPGDERRKRERGMLDGTLNKTRHSTASLGRFDPLLPKERPLKPIRQKVSSET